MIRRLGCPICITHSGGLIIANMSVHLSHPQRQVEIKGPKRVKEVLRELNLIVEAHLVIRGDDLMTEDELALDSDRLEIRPVISGGSPR